MSSQVIAESLSEEEIGGLRQLFKMLDTDNSGTITFDELKHGLRRVGSELMESDIKALMEAVYVLFNNDELKLQSISNNRINFLLAWPHLFSCRLTSTTTGL